MQDNFSGDTDMQQMRNIFIPVLLIIILSGCLSSPYYQKSYTVPGNEWVYDFQPSFKFEITDTAADHDMQFLIRHTEAYPYSNIWLMVHVKKPGDTLFERTRVEIPLAEPTGKWLGRGMGEIWEQRMQMHLGTDSTFLNIPGMWEVKLEHNMRMEPLPEILQVGLRVEKSTKP